MTAAERAHRPRFPVVRVRHPARDAGELRARHARVIARRGVLVATQSSRAVGARVELVLELRDGTLVRGEAIAVDATTGGADVRVVTFRFVELFEGNLDHDEGPSLTPAPAAIQVLEPSFEDPLTDDGGELAIAQGIADEPAGAEEPEGTIEVALRADVLETRSLAEAAERQRRAEARRARMGRALLASAALGVAALVVALAARTAELRAVDAHVAQADALLAEGRLAGGGDAALDALTAARSLQPDDPRVRERLRLVADKLEELADAALARGDFAEAAVHLTAAGQAEPERKSVHVRLGEIARTRGRDRARAAPPR
jgi:hypothetical protein